jgi:hypothetical protein
MRYRDMHFMEALYVVFLGFCLVALASCSHHERLEEKVDAKVQAEPALPPGPELNAKGHEVIFDTANLRPSQRKRLNELYSRSTEEMEKIRGEIGKHTLVLLKDLVNPKVGEDEIKLVRQKILDLDRERTDLWLKNLDDAKRILGRRTEQDEKLYRAFLLSEPVGSSPHERDEIHSE